MIVEKSELIVQLQTQLDGQSKEMEKLQKQSRGDLSTQDRSLSRVQQLEEELNNERQQRQRLVIEMHRLEQKCENLQSELQHGQPTKFIPSDSNITWDSKFMDTLDLDDLPVRAHSSSSREILFAFDLGQLRIKPVFSMATG